MKSESTSYSVVVPHAPSPCSTTNNPPCSESLQAEETSPSPEPTKASWYGFYQVDFYIFKIFLYLNNFKYFFIYVFLQIRACISMCSLEKTRINLNLNGIWPTGCCDFTRLWNTRAISIRLPTATTLIRSGNSQSSRNKKLHLERFWKKCNWYSRHRGIRPVKKKINFPPCEDVIRYDSYLDYVFSSAGQTSFVSKRG